MSDFLPTGIQLSYLVAASLFFVGLKRLGSPATARQGNRLASLAMLVAIVATLLDRQVLNYPMILLGIAIGSVIGAITAQKVAMTSMPQLVGLFNGLGGAASALVAMAEFWHYFDLTAEPNAGSTITVMLGVLIGGVTFTGSLIAFAKLQGLISGSPITFPLQQPFNAALLVSFLIGSGYLIATSPTPSLFLGLVVISLVLGVMFVIPIGGGDMPVVISLLNSFSGLAASAAGFVVMNNMLIIAGALVGASGIILTVIMCKGMNRSLSNVLFAAFGTGESGGTATGGGGSQGEKVVRNIDPEECAMMLGYARSVVIVPGYGMAVAQAQHSIRELADQLDKMGVEVKYAIHPVAGRMPGHMNVLLAEANVPYDALYDMDDINPQFEETDVALVIGANDVVNPSAETEKDSPIYGMPIIQVDRAKHAIVIKRGLSTGFAGVDNELFYRDKTMMLFGSAKDMVSKLVAEVKQL
ncbi:NAD(P)(+) transhydrogenase (Re/Si-specific) subunit beta [Phormidium yuhuli AB48]|uniref:NAD(P) transhydrogenase subunit beta n=1 Tax=Phormidium yuhuli AB48 TaxID=2940671 RepID=A0ABY5ARI3_9CYAN|nr:NAD(P)(+) transhydrogenase (Re/Si-specific) subunit beta [Phormidium yuhuli]USR91478.1 NAD(P)(+) transhydrogenase (Re/Si-specific) subunit beta [Phormidium yuhuli AB48]